MTPETPISAEEAEILFPGSTFGFVEQFLAHDENATKKSTQQAIQYTFRGGYHGHTLHVVDDKLYAHSIHDDLVWNEDAKRWMQR